MADQQPPQQQQDGGQQIQVPPLPALQPGQQPTPEQIAQIQAHIGAASQVLGITPEEYIERMKAQAMAQQQQMQQQQMQQQQNQQPVQPGPPKPEALAVANFLKSQDLKQRTCIFQEKRKDMFKVKRAIRALESDAYKKARSKNALLPEVNDRVTAENTFKLLPLSLLALRVSKIDPHEGHEGHGHGKTKRVKGQWTVKIEQQQEAHDELHYIWLYEGSQWKQKAYSLGALALVFTVVLFPLWPLFMRQGVWYLSMGMLGLIGLFFVMAIFRLILFCITVFTNKPGLWLFPNLFEDVGFFDSFRPAWAWHEDEASKKKAKKAAKQAKADRRAAKAGGADAGDARLNALLAESMEGMDGEETGATGAEPVGASGTVQRRAHIASVEEDDDE